MLRVRDAMTREVVTLGPEASAAEAWAICQEMGIRHLPVVEEGRLVGLVSDRDLRDVSPPRGSAHGRGSWVEVEVQNQPGSLANVTDVVRERQVNISGVFLTPAPRASNRLIVLRLETTNPTGVARSLEDAGFKVTTVESSSPLEPTLEEA